jgi:GMP synthase (glutamine-hydrolysing)
MRIAVFQHAAFEGPGQIGVWADQRGHSMVIHHLYEREDLPHLDDFDLLLVMGGEMNVYQYRQWPWLKPEREFIQLTLKAGKPVVGICLGAQLIADSLGARVTQNPMHELGWLPITWTKEARAEFATLPVTATVLHWHGDTFELPHGATRLAASEACAEQGFIIPGKCLGLQFHMEVDPVLVKGFVAGQGEFPTGPYVQTPEEILREAATFHEANEEMLFAMLDRFVEES